MAYTDIDNPKDYFSVNTWTADDSTPRSFTGFGHQPDLLYVKHRGSASINPTIIDSVRGGDKMLATATNAAEDTKSHGEVTAFGSDGITVADGTNGTYPKLYFNDLNPFGAGGGAYICWSWKAGTSFSNDASATSVGTIDSTGSFNNDSGISIVSYTGTGSNGTIKHGMNVAPSTIIFKAIGTANWLVYHQGIANTHGLFLNTTSARDDDATYFQDTDPTSSVFSIGTSTLVNDTNPYIAYAWSEKQGFSKFGKFIGNGNADGVFCFCGFKPAVVIIKKYSAAGNDWLMTTNGTGNPQDGYIAPNEPAAEVTGSSTHPIDMLSNGFKIRGTGGGANGSGIGYIFMAFAEEPFVNSNGVPCNAR